MYLVAATVARLGVGVVRLRIVVEGANGRGNSPDMVLGWTEDEQFVAVIMGVIAAAVVALGFHTRGLVTGHAPNL